LATIGFGQLLGLAAELHLKLLAIGAVADNLGESLEFAPLVAKCGEDGAAPESRPIATDLPLLAGHLAAGTGLTDFRLGPAGLDVLGDEEPEEGLADDLGGLIPEEERRTVIPAQHAPLGVEQQDGVIADAVEEQLHPLPFHCGLLLPQDVIDHGL